MKKQKSIHGSPQPTTPVTPRVKSTTAAAANKASANKAALGVSVASIDSVSAARGSSVVRNSMSPGRAASVGIVKQEHLDGPVQFGPVTFATEDHLVNPAIIQIDTPETGPIFIAQRDARLGPGVFLRSDKLFPIPKNKLEAVKQFMTQLDLNSPNTIWPRPVMATAAVCDRFDTLQTTIIPLLDCKKVADKLETEIQVLRARKRMLMNDVGESRAEEIIKKLPPIDPSMIAAIRATTPSTPTIDSTPVAASRHNRKGSTASSRKKAARE
ncbi:swr complex subunit [Kickxella alabastrina]|uniref:Swr complex subunit n=1 Tax=Kickxella alabastrina TaxID=61397 RepID=A0ACC1HXF6_9FUNG|nr:swr complex subunit [Kickxella alabastrina]